MQKERITRSILPFTTIFFALFLSYSINQQVAEVNGIIGIDYSYIFKEFNDAVPFLAWTIYPYLLAFAFWIGSFFYIGFRSKRNLYTLLFVGLVTFSICGLWYAIQQSDVTAWRESSHLFGRTDLSFTESVVMFIYNAAGPRNALPSMHCLMSWLVVVGVRRDKTMPIFTKIAMVAYALVVCVSTQTTKQHYIIDLIVAVALCEAAYWIIICTKGPELLERFFTKINQKCRFE